MLLLASHLCPRKVQKSNSDFSVSVIISAFNEEDCIAETVRNKLQQDFPQQNLEVIVVSDGSSDKTDEIVKELEDERITFIRQGPRQGKTAAVNLAVSHARGDILVFSDANSRYEANAIKELVDNFSDPEVGYVTGKMLYTNEDGSPIGDGCTSYMRYENFLRSFESAINSIVGVDGGIDAMRRALYEPMSPDQLPDFVQPLKVAEKGHRVIYDDTAVLYEEALADNESEFRMRVRVSLRAFWALYDMRSLLNPLNFPVYSWQIISHKLLRYMAWLPVLLVLATNILLLGKGWFFQLTGLSQLMFYALVIKGHKLSSQSDVPILFSVPYYFVLVNTAAAIAFLQFIRGKKQVLWTPRKG